MRNGILIILILSFSGAAFAQPNTDAYTIVKDSATHISVLHKTNVEILKVRNAFGDEGKFEMIAPDVKIKDGIVDHKNIHGSVDVREYYIKNKLVAYIQFDGANKEREIFYNSKGNISLEKRYYKGILKYENDSVRKPAVLLIPVKITNENSSR